MGANQLGKLDDIDPARLDVLTDKPKRKKRKRKPMGDTLKPYAAEAKARARKRPASPGLMLEPNEHGGYTVTSPHDDLEAWELQIGDAFGTRSLSLMRTFTAELRALCESSFSEQDQRWKPSERELNAALAFVSGIRPKNEIEAALAAQMLAVHWMTMKVAAQGLRGGFVCPKDAAITGKLARTFAQQAETLAHVQGKGRSRQSISIRSEKHVFQHVTVSRGDAGSGGGSSDARAHATEGGATRLIEEQPALSGSPEVGRVVRLPSRAG